MTSGIFHLSFLLKSSPTKRRESATTKSSPRLWKTHLISSFQMYSHKNPLPIPYFKGEILFFPSFPLQKILSKKKKFRGIPFFISMKPKRIYSPFGIYFSINSPLARLSSFFGIIVRSFQPISSESSIERSSYSP